MALRTKYKHPPINELIIGVYFDPPLHQLQAEHVGVFWSQLRSEFPAILQQQEMAIPVVGPTVQLSFEPYPMPRYWLIAPDEVMLLQIQRNAFLLNWRKRDKEYPHFDEVKKQFDHNFGLFKTFLKREFGIEEPPAKITELTYTNALAQGDGWDSLRDIEKVFPNLTIPDIGAAIEQEPDINYVTAYRYSPDLTLALSFRTARGPVDVSQKALIFEFRTYGVLEDGSGADDWYLRAHDVINEAFTTLTSEDIRTHVWQPE